MSYSNVDKSTLLRIEGTTYGDYILKTCRQIANYIDNILRTDFGYIRADERGDRSDIDLTEDFPDAHHFYYHYINMYKREENAENFLFCNISCGFSSTSYGEPNLANYCFSYRDHTKINWSISLGYTRENIAQDFYAVADSKAGDIPFSYIDNVIVRTPWIEDHIVTINTNNNITTTVATINIDLREIVSNSSKFLVLGNTTNLSPHIGYMTINNVITPVINVMTKYFRDSKSYIGNVANALDPESDISNILFIRGQDYRRGLNNFFSDFSFKNTKNKMPILPVFLTSTDSDSTVTYDFDKPIQGLFQTSKDFALSRNTRYILDNVSYVSLGNHFLLEEGAINQ